MAKLTRRAVAGAPTREAEYTLWDSEVPGLGVRVHPSGMRVIVFKYRVGRGRRATLRKVKVCGYGEQPLNQVRDDAHEWLAMARRGEDPKPLIAGADAAAGLTMRGLLDRYLDEHVRRFKKASSAADDERNIRNHIVPEIGNQKVTEIHKADVERVHRAVKDGKHARDEKTGKHGRRIVRGGPVVANRVLALLSHAFKKAEVWNIRPPNSNPCREVKRYAERARDRFLSGDELTRLGDAIASGAADKSLSPAAAAAVRLLALTGCRAGEILSLEWSHVDFERGALRLPHSKTGAKTVHLAPPAIEVLSGLRAVRPGNNPYVIPGDKANSALTSLAGPWRRLRARAKLEDVRLHDLRHTVASVGVASGLSLPVIGKLLGHSQPTTTQRYAHWADDPVRHAAVAVGNAVHAAMTGQAAEVVPLRDRKSG